LSRLGAQPGCAGRARPGLTRRIEHGDVAAPPAIVPARILCRMMDGNAAEQWRRGCRIFSYVAWGGNMSRCRAPSIAAFSMVALCAAFPAPAAAQTIELKISHFIPPNHTFHKWVTAWSAKLTKESGGRLKFTIYPNGQLVGPPSRQFDAARNGITDMAFV